MLKIQLLGRFSAWVDDRPVDLPLRAAQSLLAYLVLTAGRPHRREQLAGLLWPEAAESSAKGYLRHTLWRLRKALGDHDFLLTDDLTLAFDPGSDYWLDADLISGKADANASLDDLIQKVAVYHGDLLPGFYEDWVLLERERLQASFESWMSLLLDKLVAAERWADVLEWGERWIALGHTPEPAFRALLAAHAGRGDVAALATTYRRCVEALELELGVEPSQQTRAAYERWVKNLAVPSIAALTLHPLRGYHIEQHIGSGAVGVVYRAYQPEVGRRVAIKVIAPQYADRPEFIRQFESAARLVAQLEHPHIVPLFDFWREPGGAYLVMRWLPRTLRARLAAGPLEPAAALPILDQIASALAAAHRLGIAHLNLKPDNILLDDDGNAYLTDFGITRAIATLTPDDPVASALLAYMAPEQIQGAAVTLRADFYSLGLVAYEMLSGCHPFSSATLTELVDAHLHQPLPSLASVRPDRSAQIDRVLQRATAKDPADRYADVSTMLADLDSAVRGGPAKTVGCNDTISNPYKGLRAFDEADAADFFGRDALVKRLLTRLSEAGPASRLLTLVGPSGCGKSSVVRAGLIPALRRGAFLGSDRLFVVLLTPGERPLKSLETALLSIAAHPPTSLLEQLRTNARGLLWAAEEVLGEPGNNLLLVIDQFEELATLSSNEAERTQMLDLLGAAAADPDGRVRIILTLRADFLDWPLQDPAFGELMRPGLELVLPLSAEEVCRAVIGPANRVGIRVEDDLLAAIVADVSEEPGALPMLQVALTETFERREGSVMTLDAYHEAGGVAGALARQADEVYAALDEAGQAAARQMFLRLVTLGEGVEDTRRRVLQSELEALDDYTRTGSEDCVDERIDLRAATRA